MGWYGALFNTGRSIDDYSFRQSAGGPSAWGDAFRPLPVPSYPEPPQEVRSHRDLDEETRKRNRNDMLLQIAAAIAEGSQTGMLGSSLTRAAQNVSAGRKASVAEENARRQDAWQRDVSKVDRDTRLNEVRQVNQEREQKAKDVFSAWEQARGAIDGRDRALYRRAATMAETGDLSGLQKLIAEAPVRKSLLDKGVNPDDELQVLLSRQRAVDEVQLEGRLKEREALDPLDTKKAVATRQALSPLEIAQADAEARARARYREDGGGGGRQLEGRMIQAKDGTWVNADQTIPGVVLDPRTGKPLQGRMAGDTLEDKAVERTMEEWKQYDKLSPMDKQAAGVFNFKAKVQANLKMLREGYGAAAPEGDGVPGDAGSKEPGVRSTEAIVARVKMVEKSLPGLRPDQKQQILGRITAGEPASRIVREEAFPGLPRNANGLDLWYEVEDDLRKGKTVAQIKQGLRKIGIAIP